MSGLRFSRRGMGNNGLPQNTVAGADSLIGTPTTGDDSWPYFWEYPRRNAQIVQRVNSIPAPAQGVATEVLNLQVPPGFQFVLKAIRQTFQTQVGGATVFVDGSGSILWSVNVDIAAGAQALSGFALPDLANMADQRGAQDRPWPIYGYAVFGPYQTLRYIVQTDSSINPGAPNFITCGLFGWWQPLLS